MQPARATQCVTEHARALGFSLCGIASAAEFPELARLPDWLAQGYAGQMGYLADPRRASPSRVLPGARSLIVCALLYNAPEPLSIQFAASPGHIDQHRQERPGGISPKGETEACLEGPRGWISRYAWGEDYHRVLGDKLERLVAALQTEICEPFEARAYVDTGPVAERIAAKYAGLGWLGKNTCLIHPELGSWMFLGVIVTTLELAPSLGPGDLPQPDLCGQCTLCLDACPTQALVDPYVLDARRCISYLTIEHRGRLPDGLRPALGAHVFGCDICQDVCPFNRRAPVTELTQFAPRQLAGVRASSAAEDEFRTPPDLFAPPLEWLASLSEEEYREIFRGSAVKRAKFQGLVRNACVALGNAAGQLAPEVRARACALLERLSASADAVIAEHAAWALDRLSAR